MTVADYMIRCLHDPLDGYYATRPALGETGDFITAPLISQMFGEILGAWAHEVWTRLGSPKRLRLIELGPGTGVLMADILRTARIDPAFSAACEPWLVETSGPLRRLQAEAVAGVHWADRLDEVPTGVPIIIFGNEFLDCLPIHQSVARGDGWRERRVGVSEAGELTYMEGPVWDAAPLPASTQIGEVREWSPAAMALGAELAARLVADSGAALFIDYGADRPTRGDTLQALRGQAKEDPLANPGLADLTAHVDFPAFVAAAVRAGIDAAPIEKQGGFLRRLGIESRATALARASPDKHAPIERQLDRLVSADGMGELFKVAVLASKGLATP